ncbi:uncharacterized protein MTES_0091 [Microbacterium testaceum StLB037]|uniref:Uncharacterized protein n=1 Tax=Microbacterium testaceum (strain StLB037) TaxID=979556 RepID=E8N835_MICTS|nr:hypothetical protein [Microbacterium testaceum]BAJ73055.1 uncharacterized protein MTES_0091 [Microbacterium testaceum StLB037]
MTDRIDDPVPPADSAADGPLASAASEDSGPRVARSTMMQPRGAETDPRETGDIDVDHGDDGGAPVGPSEGQVSARSHVNTHGISLPSSASGSGSGTVSYGVGPFSVREVALLGIWAVAFLVSFFPDNNVTGAARLLVGGSNVWVSGLWWIAAIALPTVAVGLLVLRRLSPQGIRRVGSLGIDQFASVAFSIAAFIWVAWLWETVSIAIDTGGWVRSWVVWVEAILMLAGVVLTVAAPFIPPFAADFAGREEVPAHRNARPVRPVVPRPAAPRSARRSPAPAGSAVAPSIDAATSSHDGADVGAPGDYVRSTEGPRPGPTDPPTSVLTAVEHAPDPHASSDHASANHASANHANANHASADQASADHANANQASADHAITDHANASDDHPTDVLTRLHDLSAEPAHPAAQAFWALAPVEREVVDDYGTPIFRIGPSAWALVIEDRGETFVIRHDDGRIGYLHDVSGVTRG